ncbi:hypothetical protein E4T39_08542, partial [Aureobasidium subglaciale]
FFLKFIRNSDLTSTVNTRALTQTTSRPESRQAGSTVEDMKFFLESPLFNTFFKARTHYIQLTLVTLIIILTGFRISQKLSFLTIIRSDTMAIVMIRRQEFLPSFDLIMENFLMIDRLGILSLWTAITTRKSRREERYGGQTSLPVYYASKGKRTTTKSVVTYTTYRV